MKSFQTKFLDFKVKKFLDSFSTNTRVKRDSEGENTYFIEMLMVMDEYVVSWFYFI